jgi:two-component system, cell cycle sensor histidine kinase and response regulator CckA
MTHRRRILVIDDEQVVITVVQRILTEAGFEVLPAAHGPAGLECLAREGSVDLVLSDVVMPAMTAGELGKELTTRFPSVPVVWMSGFPKDRGQQDGLEFAYTFIQKPITREILLKMLAEHLKPLGEGL